jgi:predicted dehydrogenase
VLLATPARTHHVLARRALEAKRHVFVEKPLAHSVAHAADLVTLAENVERVLMVGHTFLFSPRVEWLYDYVNNNGMGPVHYAASSRLNLGLHRTDINVIWDLGPHDFSIIFHLLGEFPVRVQSTARGMVIDGQPEVAFIHMVFPSGAIASVNLSWLAPRKVRQLTLVGAQSMVLYEDTHAEEPVKVHDKGVEVPDSTDWGQHQLTYRYGDTIAPHIPVQEPLNLELRHFLSCLTSGERPRSDGEFGLGVVTALEAADRSWRSGGAPVEVVDISRIPVAPHMRIV